MAAKRSGRHSWTATVRLKRPGALTRKAKRAGESPLEFARKHTHDSNPTTRAEANFALNVRKGRRRTARKSSRSGGRR